MKKNVYVLALAAIVLGFTSCQKEPNISEDFPVPYVKVTTDSGKVIANGEALDPTKVEYIELTFDQPMNTEKGSLLAYYYEKEPKGDTWNGVTNYGWVNNFTYRIYTYLLYNHNYAFEWNDVNSIGSSYTKENSFFVSKQGAYTENNKVYFSTIASPNKNVPQQYTINVNFKQTIELEENSYAPKDYPNQQVVYTKFHYYLNHEYLRPGDTVTVNYKVTSPHDITSVKINIVDSSRMANYWTLLSDLTAPEGELAGYNLVPETFKPNDTYTGSLTFTVAAQMVDSLDFQVVAPFSKESGLYNITFLKLE